VPGLRVERGAPGIVCTWPPAWGCSLAAGWRQLSTQYQRLAVRACATLAVVRVASHRLRTSIGKSLTWRNCDACGVGALIREASWKDG